VAGSNEKQGDSVSGADNKQAACGFWGRHTHKQRIMLMIGGLLLLMPMARWGRNACNAAAQMLQSGVHNSTLLAVMLCTKHTQPSARQQGRCVAILRDDGVCVCV
jgi:hypothetical protein